MNSGIVEPRIDSTSSYYRAVPVLHHPPRGFLPGRHRIHPHRLGGIGPRRASRPRERQHRPHEPLPDKRKSGNPATQADIDLTVKQQREQKRQDKLAEYQKQIARRKRSKLVWWVVGSTAALAVVAVVVASFALAPAPAPSYQAGNTTGREIEGVETFQNRSDHVQGAVTYEQTPPPAARTTPTG